MPEIEIHADDSGTQRAMRDMNCEQRDPVHHPLSPARAAACELEAALARVDGELSYEPSASQNVESPVVRSALRERIGVDIASAQATAMAANAQRGVVQWVRADAHAKHDVERQKDGDRLIAQQATAMRAFGEAIHALVQAASTESRLHGAHFRSVERGPDRPAARARFEQASAELRAVNADMAAFVLKQPTLGIAVSSSTSAFAVTAERHVTFFLGRENEAAAKVTLPSGDQVDVTVHDHDGLRDWNAGLTGRVRLAAESLAAKGPAAHDDHFGVTAETISPATVHVEKTEHKTQRHGGWFVEGGSAIQLGPLEIKVVKVGSIDLELRGGIERKTTEVEKHATADRVEVGPTVTKASVTFHVVRAEPRIELENGPRRER